ncbi:MAG: type II toxin-antitoxin system ParD family antitoxin [Brasilonema angustatum HA4187-MV1]|jgi:putative addiction module CopG family antidote|nr:type II toxin-antitoxin system ParD family antitoxin [Brasilonema angustatum HA4187-MV1]
MNISLNPEQEDFIKKQIEKGKYTNALEVISAAFKVLEEKELQPDNSPHTNENKIVLDDDKIRSLMKFSESAINEYWLNEEEDEAWKNLYNT